MADFTGGGRVLAPDKGFFFHFPAVRIGKEASFLTDAEPDFTVAGTVDRWFMTEKEIFVIAGTIQSGQEPGFPADPVADNPFGNREVAGGDA